MNFTTAATTPHSPPFTQVPALSTLLARNPLLRTVCQGVAVGPLLGPRAALVSSDGRPTDADPILQQELCAVATRWAERVTEIGLTPLAVLHRFSDEPPSPEIFALDGRDTAALHEALAYAMSGTELDPTTMSCVVHIDRDPTHASETVCVPRNRSAPAETWGRLSAAAWRWYLPRRPWFSSLTEAYFEIDGEVYWSWAARNRL